MTRLIGMLGPIQLSELRNHLPSEVYAGPHPEGLGGSPVNLLCNELLARGHRLVVFSLDPSVQREQVFEGPRLKVCFGPFRRNRARDFFKEERSYLIAAIKRERPEILHAQWTYEYALAAISSRLPHLVTAHDAPLNVLRHNFIPYRMVRTLMAFQACRCAEHIVAVSPHVARQLNRFHFHEKPIETVPNGMPESLFQRERRRRDFCGDISFATVLNGWRGLKNGEAAIRAFAMVRGTLPGARLLMFGIGHGPEESAARWAREQGLQRGIEFIGLTPHSLLLERLAGDVDILVHPSLEESHCMALIEAMALGVPVIGGESSGSVPWTLEEGACGLLVDVRSPRAIAQGMLRLAGDGVARSALGQKGRDSVRRRFHIENIATRYEAFYEELAGSAP
jgi:L-malate glycosyltransferase